MSHTTPLPREGDSARAWPLSALLLVMLLTFAELLGILRMNQGHLVFSMDDPYIHFALGYRLMSGHYGINTDSFSAPSSSILWPLLITPLTGQPQSLPYAVVAFNVAASLLTLCCFWRAMGPTSTRHDTGWRPVVLALLAYIGTNQTSLVFTGLEHSLQVALCATMTLGMLRHTQDQRVRWWWVAAIVTAPWVRYECTALSMVNLAYLAWSGHRRLAALTLTGMLTPMLAFSVFLKHLGLTALPSSIVVKTALTAYHSMLPTWLLNIKLNVMSGKGLVMSLAALWMAWLTRRQRTPRLLRGASAALAVATAAHLALGQMGFRYEIYIWACITILALHCHPQWSELNLGTLMKRAQHQPAQALLAALLLIQVGRFAPALLSTPRATNNIYEQQYQMGRFVHDYLKQTVAVNDLGYVAYRNARPVLDLWGLGSQEAIQARRSSDPYWFDTLARQHQVPYAIIYDEWFPPKPPSWMKVAELKLSRKPVFAAGDTVQFYALDCQAADRVTAALQAFKPTIPPGTTLTLHPQATLACRRTHIATAPA